MKTISVAFFVLFVIFALCTMTGFAQDAKKPADTHLTEIQKTAVNLQLALQANAELRKQLAQERAKSADLEKQVADFEVKSETANVQAINANAGPLLEKMATDLGIKLSENDFNLQEMKFTPKPKPTAAVKQPEPPAAPAKP